MIQNSDLLIHFDYIPCILQNTISLDVNTNKTPQKCQVILWHQEYFSHEDEFFVHAKKFTHVLTQNHEQQGISKQLEIKPCWVSNPQQGVTTLTNEERRILFLSIPHVPKIGTSKFSLPGQAGVKLLAYAELVLPT